MKLTLHLRVYHLSNLKQEEEEIPCGCNTCVFTHTKNSRFGLTILVNRSEFRDNDI